MLFGSAHQLLSLYDITENLFSGNVAQSVQIASADPNRTCLIISITTTTSATISTKPNNASTKGISLTASSPTIQFTIHDNPALVQSAWFLPPTNTVQQCTVITISEHPLEGM